MERIEFGPLMLGIVVAVCLVMAAVAAVAWHLEPDASDSGTTNVRTTTSATVIRDPWCARSEDSCRINYRANGLWIVRRVTP